MMKSNVKKVIVSVVAILLLLGVACTTYATDIQQELAEILSNQAGNIIHDGNLEDIPEGNNTNKVLNTKVETNSNTNISENLPVTTPHTGLGDYSGLIFVAVFAIAAIYAYKKVKEYNV